MSGLRVPSFTEWLSSGLKPQDTLQEPDVTVRGYGGFEIPSMNGRGEIVVFDPANLRRTTAAFDPAKRNSKNLLASGAAAAVGIPTFAEFLANQQNPNQ